jgi:hypothetical protein
MKFSQIVLYIWEICVLLFATLNLVRKWRPTTDHKGLWFCGETIGWRVLCSCFSTERPYLPDC